MSAIRQRRPAVPDAGGQVLAAGRPARSAGGGGVHPAGVAFFAMSLLFMVYSLAGGGGSATASLRDAKAGTFLVPGYTAASMERYKKERRNLAVVISDFDPSEEDILDSSELRKYFDCARVNAKRPVITEDEWRYFRDLYNEFIAEEFSHGRNDTYKWGAQNIPSPVVGASTPDKGRGLVAARDIAEGERVFTGTNNTIVYRTGNAWRGFLLHLYYSPPLGEHYRDGFACDIMAWSWNQEIETSDSGVVATILVDLDASSLLNHPSRDEAHNIQCGTPGSDDKCRMDYYAVKNIKKGEEILCEYGDFSHQQWDTFGL